MLEQTWERIVHPPGTLNGQSDVANSTSSQAAANVVVAYDALDANIYKSTGLGTPFGNGAELNAGVYCVGSAATFNL